jgi:hypothetical protein
VKETVLKTVDDAVAAGFAHTWACALWQVSDSRVHRWRARRRDAGTLVDSAPGGHPVHALLPGEVAAVLDVAERWGTVDRSHRKLAHRGSYEQLVWVSPATFRRVLITHGLTLPAPSTAQQIREAAVAGLAGVGAEPDLDLGRHAFHPLPSGLLRDRRHGVAQVDRHARLGRGDRHPGSAQRACRNT